jgi:alpha-N-arabinofuranosidase
VTTATIRIDGGREHRVPVEIYGHFLESAFFGNIEDGVFDEGSPSSVVGSGALDGCRQDVIDVCRQLGLPVVRWPGGNFASGYHWEDGTGPRDARPRRLELAWRTEESNRFGTPEFLAWADAVGTERMPTAPYLHHGARSVDDAVRWVEYTNWAGDTEYTRRRAADGHPEPYGVRWWGVGNEVYGAWQMGRRDAAQYVKDAAEHVRFMRKVDPAIRFIACGWERQEWIDTVVRGLGDKVDAFSLHLYGVDHHLVDPSEHEFDQVVAQSLYFEQSIGAFADEIARTAASAHIDRPLGIVMDEWNNRHLEPSSWPEPEPGARGGTADRGRLDPDHDSRRRVNRHSPRTLADALMYAGVFHAMHRAAGHEVPVIMANAVNLVNANGIIQVRPDGVIRTPVFHLWSLYQNHLGRRALGVEVTAPSTTRAVRLGAAHADAYGVAPTRHAAVALLDVTAARSDDGTELTLGVVNRSARNAIDTTIVLDGRTTALPSRAHALTIGADATDLFATNSLDAPDEVGIRENHDAAVSDGRYTFPAHSITVLRFRLA